MQFKDLPLASSLRLATGNSFDISLVLEVLLQQLKIQLTRVDNQDFEAIFNSYNQDLFRLDTVAVFSTNTKVPFNAILRGVTKSGLLVLEDEASQRDTYNLKEIKYHF
jgi:BirA family biotin operon repressor/biotin-[acetyl-CoA-carboxylase] ligase